MVEKVFRGFKKASNFREYCSYLPLLHYQHTWYNKLHYYLSSAQNPFFAANCVDSQESMCINAATSTGMFDTRAIPRLKAR